MPRQAKVTDRESGGEIYSLYSSVGEWWKSGVRSKRRGRKEEEKP